MFTGKVKRKVERFRDFMINTYKLRLADVQSLDSERFIERHALEIIVSQKI